MITVGKAVLVQAVKRWHYQVYLMFQRMFPPCVIFRFVFIETSISLVFCCSSVYVYHPSLVTHTQFYKYLKGGKHICHFIILYSLLLFPPLCLFLLSKPSTAQMIIIREIDQLIMSTLMC